MLRFANRFYVLIFLMLFAGLVFPSYQRPSPANYAFGSAINSRISDIGNPEFRFAQVYKDDLISSSAIAEFAKDLSGEQVCISLGEYGENSNLQTLQKSQLIQANDNYTVKAAVVCDSADGLQATVNSYNTYFDGVNLANECDFDLTKTNTACLVAVNEIVPGPEKSKPKESPLGLLADGLGSLIWILILLTVLLNAALSTAAIFLVKGFKKIFYLAKLGLWILALVISALIAPLLALFVPFMIIMLIIIILQPTLSFFANKDAKAETYGKNTALICKSLIFLDLALIVFLILMVLFG